MDLIALALAKKKLTQAVSDYLGEHLTNPTNPPIDNSLTIENAAADAKAAGTAISQLNADLTAKVSSVNNVTPDANGNVALEIETGDFVEYTSKESGERTPEAITFTDTTANSDLNTSTGAVTSGNKTISDYIDIHDVARLYGSASSSTRYLSDVYCIYDENKNFLAGYAGNTSYTFETIDGHENCIRYDLSATGAYYIRTSVNTGVRTYYKVGTYDIYDTEIKEVRDARTDYDGTEQDTLAEALSASYTAIKGEFDDVADEISDLKGFESVGTAELAYPYVGARAVKLTASASTALGLHGITVADSDNMGTVTYSNIEEVSGYTGTGKKYRITTASSSGNDYRINGRVSGLTIGKTYRVCLKVTDSQNDSSGGGHYAMIYCKGSLKSIGNTVSEEHVFTFTFIATTTSTDIYIYPFMSNSSTVYTQAVGDEFVIEDWYINEVNGNVDLYTHEACFNTSVTGTELSYTLNGKMFVATGTGATVYVASMPSKLLTVNGTEPDADGDVTVKSHLQNKTIVCFGDSITNKGYGEYTDYPYLSSEITGANTINAGIGGTTMRYRTNYANWDKVSFAHMADMIVSGDFSDVATLGQSDFEVHDRCEQLAPILEAIDWNNVDIITLAYGANDHTTSTLESYLDDESDKYNKYKYLGAFRYAVETILAEYPHIQFLVLTPVYRYWTIDGVVVNSDERTYEDINDTTSYYYDWGDALKTCAENEYHVPVCDFYRELGINSANRTWFSTDGVHPDEDGLARMGSHLASALISRF